MSNWYGSLITETYHPFARSTASTANTTGAIYSATVSSSAVADTFTTVELATVPLPVNAVIKELEFGLTGAFSETTTTAAFELRWQITDNGGSSYDALVISTSYLSYAGTLLGSSTDITYSGRITPTSGTNFTGRGPFDVLLAVGCGSTTKAQGATKNSSYITCKYYLLA